MIFAKRNPPADYDIIPRIHGAPDFRWKFDGNVVEEGYHTFQNANTWDSGTKIVASASSAYYKFGASVGISGDYAIVGAIADSAVDYWAGAAYIYHRTGTNTWDSGAQILASDAESGDEFGGAVAIDGDYAIVGATDEDAEGGNAGAAYIYHRTGTNTWDSGTKIVASDAETGDNFGNSVSISGDYAIVGAWKEDTEASDAGAAYIFRRTGSNTWDSGTKIVASDAEANDQFGYSVAIDGDYAIVGARYENTEAGGAGAAYIYHRTGTNTWDSGTKIVASDAQETDYFGYSVAISGDYAIVGAVGEAAGGAEAGAAYIFQRTGTNTWDSGTKIVASDAAAGDTFGNSVSISGDYAIVGAYQESAGGSDAGAAYIFQRTGANTWDSGTKSVASDAQEDDQFGYSVSIDGDYAIAGAVQESAEGTEAGAAYIFQSTATGISWVSGIIPNAPHSQCAQFDGSASQLTLDDHDLINTEDVTCKSVSLWFKAHTVSGSQTLFEQGGGTNWMHLYLDDSTLIWNVGESSTSVGDVSETGIDADTVYHVVCTFDSDGTLDLYVNNVYTSGSHTAGELSSSTGDFVIGYCESARDKDSTSHSNTWYFDGEISDFCMWTERDRVVNSFEVEMIYNAGQANRSWYPAVPQAKNSGSWAAPEAVWVMESGLWKAVVMNEIASATQEKIVASDAEATDYFGYSVSISGDYAIVGAYYEEAGGTAAGAAYIFHRTGPNTWDSGTKIVASDAAAQDQFGYSVAIDGDYAIVGAFEEDAGGSDAGAAYIFHRTGTNTWDSGTKIVAADAAADDKFGVSVSISGDYAIVGAYLEDAGGSSAGAAYIFHRTGTTTWDSGTKIVASDAAANDRFGGSVGISGDYAIVGANQEGAGGTNAGAAYIFNRTGTNTWDSGTKIVASDAQAHDAFGVSVSISGDYAIVGAWEEDTEASDAGAAYIFRRTGTTTWDSGTKIVASDAEASDQFGGAVAIDGDYVIVGAPYEGAGGMLAGAAYVYRRTGRNIWDAGTKIVASDADSFDYFGSSVAIDGDYVIVGAYQDDDGGSSSGSAYIDTVPTRDTFMGW